MKVYGPVIAALWAGFLLFWLAAAFRSKRSVGVAPGGRLARLLVTVGVWILVRLSALHGVGALRHPVGAGGPVTGGVGVLLCLLGLSLAVWARLRLGRNWGVPMAVKEGPELVTGGPYALVRHPIYTSSLLAALATSSAWLLALPVVGAYFLYSAVREEKLMADLFPGEYPAYRSRTKMLIPFVF